MTLKPSKKEKTQPAMAVSEGGSRTDRLQTNRSIKGQINSDQNVLRFRQEPSPPLAASSSKKRGQKRAQHFSGAADEQQQAWRHTRCRGRGSGRCVPVCARGEAVRLRFGAEFGGLCLFVKTRGKNRSRGSRTKILWVSVESFNTTRETLGFAPRH